LASFAIELAKVLIWPLILFLLIYLKGESFLAVFQAHTIRMKRKGLTLEILPPIAEIPKKQELLEEVSQSKPGRTRIRKGGEE